MLKRLLKKYGGDNYVDPNKAAAILENGYIRNKPLTFKQKAFFNSQLNRAYGGLTRKYDTGGAIENQIPLNINPEDKVINSSDIKMKGKSKYTIDTDYYFKNRSNKKIIKPVQNFLIDQGFLPSGSADGLWGGNTQKALQNYVTSQHISNFEWGDSFQPSEDYLSKKIFVESGGYSDVKSKAGASGIMQFMPRNVKSFQKGGKYFDKVRTGWSPTNNADAILGSQLYLRDLAENYNILTDNMNQQTKEAFINIAYNWSPSGSEYLRKHLENLKYTSGDKKGKNVDINDLDYWLTLLETDREFTGGFEVEKDAKGDPLVEKYWWTAEDIKRGEGDRGGWEWREVFKKDSKGQKIPKIWYIPEETTDYIRISQNLPDKTNVKVSTKLDDLSKWNYTLDTFLKKSMYRKKLFGGYEGDLVQRFGGNITKPYSKARLLASMEYGGNNNDYEEDIKKLENKDHVFDFVDKYNEAQLAKYKERQEILNFLPTDIMGSRNKKEELLNQWAKEDTTKGVPSFLTGKGSKIKKFGKKVWDLYWSKEAWTISGLLKAPAIYAAIKAAKNPDPEIKDRINTEVKPYEPKI